MYLPVKIKKIRNHIIFITAIQFTKTNLDRFFGCRILGNSLKERKDIISTLTSRGSLALGGVGSQYVMYRLVPT